MYGRLRLNLILAHLLIEAIQNCLAPVLVILLIQSYVNLFSHEQSIDSMGHLSDKIMDDRDQPIALLQFAHVFIVDLHHSTFVFYHFTNGYLIAVLLIFEIVQDLRKRFLDR